MDYSKINEAINKCIYRYEHEGVMVADDINELFKEVGIDRVAVPHDYRDNPIHAVAVIHLRLIQLMIKDAE